MISTSRYPIGALNCPANTLTHTRRQTILLVNTYFQLTFYSQLHWQRPCFGNLENGIHLKNLFQAIQVMIRRYPKKRLYFILLQDTLLKKKSQFLTNMLYGLRGLFVKPKIAQIKKSDLLFLPQRVIGSLLGLGRIIKIVLKSTIILLNHFFPKILLEKIQEISIDSSCRQVN